MATIIVVFGVDSLLGVSSPPIRNHCHDYFGRSPKWVKVRYRAIQLCYTNHLAVLRAFVNSSLMTPEKKSSLFRFKVESRPAATLTRVASTSGHAAPSHVSSIDENRTAEAQSRVGTC